MPASRIFLGIAACAFFSACATPPVAEQETEAEAPAQIILDARWEASLAAFAQADREHAPLPDGVLFVGSSSIRLWDKLERQFDTLPIVINRGFGGSRLADCAAYVDRLVLPYRPKLVLVYAGDNDLAEGATPQQVRNSLREFVTKVRRTLPDTRIAYISIKPSPARLHLLGTIRQTNALLKAYMAGVRNADYIDIFTPMLGADGAPRAELFRADALHLNDDGYALWKAIISSHIADYAKPKAGRHGPTRPDVRPTADATGLR